MFNVCSPSAPSLLHVNHEFSAIALKSYQLIEISTLVTKIHIPPPNAYRTGLGGHCDCIFGRTLRIHEFSPDYCVSNPNPVQGPCTPTNHKATRYHGAQKVYVNLNQDTIYLGPRFNPADWSYLKNSARLRKCSQLKNPALDGTLWLQTPSLTRSQLQTLLQSLKGEPIKRLSIFFDGLTIEFPSRPTGFQVLGPSEVHLPYEPSNPKLLNFVVAKLKISLERIWTYRVKKSVSMRAPPKVVVKCIRREGNMAMDVTQGNSNGVLLSLKVFRKLVIPVSLRRWTPPT